MVAVWLSHGACLDCMLPGIQVTADLGFFLHSSHAVATCFHPVPLFVIFVHAVTNNYFLYVRLYH